MKRKFITYLFLGILLSAACACDDDDEEIRSVQGRWQGTLLEVKLEAFGVTVRSEKDDTFDAVIEFKSGGEVTIEDEGQSATGTWKQSGKTITITADFSIEGIDLSGDYTIKEISETKLELYTERNGKYEDPDSGVEIEGTIKATLYFNALP